MLRMLRTIRHLSLGQLAAQVVVRLRRRLERPERILRLDAESPAACRWKLRTAFLPPPAADRSMEDIIRGKFSFLNDPRDVGFPPAWRGDDLPLLWQYNLHYFEVLWLLDYADARTIVLDWIAHHPPARAHLGWHPYPTSLRLVNWCCVFLGRFASQVHRDGQFLSVLWPSVLRQAEWLARHMETHLRGNHLFENAAALTLLGECFSGRAADRWLRRGRQVLRRELREQILPDGTHFERSPMYHCRVLAVLLTLLNVCDDAFRDTLAGPAERMLEALTRMTHGDSQIALLNDSAMGIYNTPEDLARFAGDLGLSTPVRRDGPFALRDGGYFGCRCRDGVYVICDAGDIGPPYVPGHAHGDFFSFELSLNSQRVIVDSGVSEYAEGPMRDYCRATRAHNTVEIDGQDQCEFWGAFRVARRGRVRDLQWRAEGEGFTLRAWHDGYTRLPGRPVHTRLFALRAGAILMVHDTVCSGREVTAVARLHLHPACAVAIVSPRRARVTYPGGACTICFAGKGTLKLEDSLYCPRFGLALPNKTLAWTAP